MHRRNVVLSFSAAFLGSSFSTSAQAQDVIQRYMDRAARSLDRGTKKIGRFEQPERRDVFEQQFGRSRRAEYRSRRAAVKQYSRFEQCASSWRGA